MIASGGRRRLIIAGGGHAHLQVLADWIKNGPPPCETLLISTGSISLYSGMIPGWIAGDYRLDEATIDLRPLAARAGVTFRQATLTAASMPEQTVTLADGSVIAFDWLSVATGGSDRSEALGDRPQTLHPIRPIDRFAKCWTPSSDAAQLAVIGGGAGGVELAFALRASAPNASVFLVMGEMGLLPDFSSAVRERVRRALAAHGIDTQPGNASIAGKSLHLDDGTTMRPGRIVSAIGSGPPRWLAQSGLALDEIGFAQVDAFHRSVSHPCVFATGDAAHRVDIDLPHAGVHAVHAGPILAHNLRAAIEGGADFRRYHPHKNTLYLLSTGDKRAILTWGRLSAEGSWVWRLKDWIDRRWINKFRNFSRRV